MADVIVTPGNSLKVDYIVENFGDDPDTQNVELVRTDTSTVVDSVTGIQLDTGNIDTGEVLWDTTNVSIGEYTVELRTADDTESIVTLVSDQAPAGTIGFLAGNASNTVYQLEPDTAFDINTFNQTGTFDTSGLSSVPLGASFNNDGSKYYIAAISSAAIYEFTLSTEYDITTASLNFTATDVPNLTEPSWPEFTDSGNILLVADRAEDRIAQYSLSTPYDISNRSYDGSFSISSQGTSPVSIISVEGGSLVHILTSNSEIYEYTLSDSTDIRTASFSQLLDVSSESGSGQSIEWNSDGTELFYLGGQNDSLYKYDVSTPYDIGTASFIESVNLESFDTTLTSFVWNEGPNL